MTEQTIYGSYVGTTYRPYLRVTAVPNVSTNRTVLTVTFGMLKARTNSESYNQNPQTVTITVNGVDYTRRVSFDMRSLPAGSECDLATVSGIVIDQPQGSAVTVTLSASHPTRISLGTGAVSGSITLEQIARASKIASLTPKVAPGDTLTLAVSTISDAFRHVSTFFVGQTLMHTSEAFGRTLTMTVPQAWAAFVPDSTRAVVTVKVTTYTDSTLAASVGEETSTFMLTIPASAAPTVSTGWLTVEKVDITSDTATMSRCIAGKNRVSFTFDRSKITTYGGASVDSLTVTSNGRPVTDHVSGVIDVKTVFTVTVRDTRGLTYKENITIDPYPYSPPAIYDATVWRTSANGAETDGGSCIRVRANASYSTCGGENILIMQARTAPVDGDFSPWELIGRNSVNVIKTDALSSKSYIIEVKVFDMLGGEAVWTKTVPTSAATLSFRDGGSGAAFGKYAETDGVFENAWDLHQLGDAVFSGKLTVRATPWTAVTNGRYMVENDNAVTLALDAPAVTGVVLTMPVGTRPAEDEYFVLPSGGGTACIKVSTSGGVSVTDLTGGERIRGKIRWVT